jgi:hypothetical protein
MTDAHSPWQRILLATEHTAFDVGAERVGLALAARSRLPLVAMVPLVSNPALVAEAPELSARVDEEAALRRTALLHMATSAGVSINVRVGSDADPWRAIVAGAADARADLVVVRRRGHRGFLARMMVGEMAASVAAHAPCDVLMVPRAGELWRSAVLAAVDDAPTSSRVAAAAARVARAFALPLQLVCVAADASDAAGARAQESLRRTIDALARDGHAAEGRVRVGRSLDDEIVAAATERGADLIVVGRRGASGTLRRAVLGSTAQKVVGLASCPVLVVQT